MYLITVILLAMNPYLTIFEFNTDCKIETWSIVDDVVMGGRSDGNITLDANGDGVFSGKVSTENNGGFSSVRYVFEAIDPSPYKSIILKIKGDGKQYQFRIKSDVSDPQAYIHIINTTSEWQEIEIPLADMYPTYRGRKLDMPNYPNEVMEEVRFLIGNKANEQFELKIKSITLR